MKKNLLIIFATLALFSCIQDDLETPIQPPIVSNELTASDFVKGSEDIPLVSNLVLSENNNVDFDSDSGSFAVVDYESPFDLEVVQGFYLRTLPQMGWKLVKNDQKHSRFIRDSEKLEIDFIQSDTEDEDDLVRFSLSSISKK